jgi:FkbM family methyltransferase
MQPPKAKLHDGVWLPEVEQHLVHMMSPGAKSFMRLPDGRPAYQRHKYLALMERVPADRRRRFIDIGAHVGLWSMQAELDFGFVVAFEPQSLHADIYPFNMRTDRWELHRVALGEAPGSVSLACEPTSTGDTHVAGPGDIPMVTLDSFGLAPDVIKIDTEGYELPILRGAVETILRHRPIICVEQKGREVTYQGGQRDEAVAFLRSLGMVPLRAPISGDHFLGWRA